MNPLVTYEAYHNLMEICLRSGNPVSHYIEGIKLYFVQESTAMGLFHLKKSAEGLYDSGTYLYAILMLFTGNQAEGTEFLRSLGWETSRRRADRCWRENRLALRFVIIPMKDEYTININSSIRTHRKKTVTSTTWTHAANDVTSTNKCGNSSNSSMNTTSRFLSMSGFFCYLYQVFVFTFVFCISMSQFVFNFSTIELIMITVCFPISTS